MQSSIWSESCQMRISQSFSNANRKCFRKCACHAGHCHRQAFCSSHSFCGLLTMHGSQEFHCMQKRNEQNIVGQHFYPFARPPFEQTAKSHCFAEFSTLYTYYSSVTYVKVRKSLLLLILSNFAYLVLSSNSDLQISKPIKLQ